MNGMIEFRTLGTPDLRDDSDRHAILSVLAQPKRVGLLAYLVMAEGGRAVSRDKLQAVFWPKASSDRARNSLNQAVFVLRRAMGDHLLVTNGEGSIGVNADRLGCDAWRFEEHIAAGEKPEALALYGGHFLEGLYVSGAPAFERWLEAERKRHRDLALAAASELTAEAESAGKPSEALEWARQAARLAPYDEDVHRRLLRCLLQLGNRAGAIRAYEAFAARLEHDLGFEPCTETQALFELAHEEPTAASRAIPIGANGLPPTTRLPTTRARGGRLQAVAFVGTAIVFLAVGGLVGQAFERSIAARAGSNLQVDRNRVPALDSKRVLVAGFENLTGDPELDPFGLVAADWITQELGRSGLVRVVPFFTVLREIPHLELEEGDARAIAEALAERTGAGILVTGSYVQEGEGLALQAQIVDVATGELLAGIDGLSASAEAPTEILGELRDRIAGALAGALDPRLASTANVASRPPSIEAYRLYAEGLDLFFRQTPSEYRQSAERFRRAAALDSTFTSPLLWAIFSYRNAWDRAGADSLVRTLDEFREQLAPWDRAMLDYHKAALRRDRQGAYEAMRRVVELSPGSEWAYMLAYRLLQINRPREAVQLLTSLDPEQGWMRSWPRRWSRLAQARHMLGEHELELRDVQRGLLQHPGSEVLVERELIALAALGRVEEVFRRLKESRTNVDSASDVRVSAVWRASTAISELKAHGHSAAADVIARRMLPYLLERAPELEATEEGQVSLGIFLYVAGELETSRRIFERLAAEYWGSEPISEAAFGKWIEGVAADPASYRPAVNALGALGAIAARLGDRQEARRISRRLGALASTGWRIKWRASIAAYLGERERAIELVRETMEKYSLPWVHSEAAFEPLWDYPPFQELLRAKG